MPLDRDELLGSHQPLGPTMAEVEWARRILSQPDVRRAIAIAVAAAEASEEAKELPHVRQR